MVKGKEHVQGLIKHLQEQKAGSERMGELQKEEMLIDAAWKVMKGGMSE